MEDSRIGTVVKIVIKDNVNNSKYSIELTAKFKLYLYKGNYNEFWDKVCYFVNHYIDDYFSENICRVINLDVSIEFDKKDSFSMNYDLSSNIFNPAVSYPPMIQLYEEIKEYLNKLQFIIE